MKKQILLKYVKSMAAGFAIISSLIFISSNTSNAQTSVKNIVLVHGAFADGSGWEETYKILKSRGYNVSVVGYPNTSLADDIATTKLTIAMQDGPVILVGHSYGGAIVTGAGNSEKVVGLVFVAALVPDANETLIKLLQSGPPAPKSGILPPKDGYVWYDKAKYHSGFCADISKEKAEFMANSQPPFPAAIFGESVSAAAWKTKPSWFVVATEDESISPAAERLMAKRAGSTVVEIKGSHAVYMSQPKAVADVIEAAAKGVVK